jgi:hypothetical protein
MEELAKRVAQHAGGSIELGRIRWRWDELLHIHADVSKT